MKNVEPVFLYQTDIVDWLPVPRGVVDFKKSKGVLAGSTKLISRFPVQSIDINPDDYHVIGSAVIYLAKVRRCREKYNSDLKPEEAVLLADGGIDIYHRTHKKQAVEINHIHGRLWFAVPYDIHAQPTLEQMIFGQGRLSGEEYSKIVEKIIMGYRV